MKNCLLILSLAATGLIGNSRVVAGPAQAGEKHLPAGELGSHLPDFRVKDLQGNALTASSLHGKAVLIDFWATWCEPCKKEMPGYQKLLDRYGPKVFAVIGFKFETMRDTEDPLQFAKKIGVRYPLAVATDEVRRKFGGIEGLPTTMLYDREGILRMKVVGFEYTEKIEAALKPLL